MLSLLQDGPIRLPIHQSRTLSATLSALVRRSSRTVTLPISVNGSTDVSTNPGNDRPIDRGEDEIAGPVRR